LHQLGEAGVVPLSPLRINRRHASCSERRLRIAHQGFVDGKHALTMWRRGFPPSNFCKWTNGFPESFLDDVFGIFPEARVVTKTASAKNPSSGDAWRDFQNPDSCSLFLAAGQRVPRPQRASEEEVMPSFLPNLVSTFDPAMMLHLSIGSTS